jgi:hypothetical protein
MEIANPGYVDGMDLLLRPSVSRPVRVLAFATGALVIATAVGTPASAAAVTTSSVLAAAKAAIAKQSSVHLVLTMKPSSSSSTEKAIGDLGEKSGAEYVSLGKANLTLKVNPTDGYVSGNSSGLTTLFGLTSAQAKKLGKDWAAVKTGTSEYSGFKSGLTISSIMGMLPAAKGTKLSTEVVKGAKLYVLKWTAAATSSTPALSDTMTVSAVGVTLPVEETMAASGGGKETIIFSNWGEHVVVNAPPVGSTIAYSKITG